jgi:predicted AAA+ superfamily ATPase
MVCYLTGIKTKEQLLESHLAGALFENFVVQETVKFFFNKGVRPSLFYLRTHNGAEIDLLIEHNLQLSPFEIKFTKSPSVDMAGVIEKIKKIFNKLKIGGGKVIYLGKDDITLTKAVSAVSLDSYMNCLETQSTS